MAMTDHEMMNPILKQKWRKYYKIDEVDSHLFRIMNETDKERKAFAALRVQYESLEQIEDEQKSRLDAMNGQLHDQAKELIEKARELEQLKRELIQNKLEKARQSEVLTSQTIELARYQASSEKLKELLERTEIKNPVNLILEADVKAEGIVARAVKESEQIFLQINEQRAKVISASRAAYYNALQFKQELAEQFNTMEKELDSSIDLLRTLENPRLTLSQIIDAPRVVRD